MNNIKKGTLYIVPTPIGNLNDISNRIIEVLKNVNFIACEDTRKTLKLLNAFSIKNNLISYYKDNEETSSNNLISLLLENNDIALVSDSGTPLISDPGSKLINKAIKEGVNIISIPGPSAAITSLVASGFDISSFVFFGFLNKTASDLEKIKTFNTVTIVYEAPHRILSTLEKINNIMPDRQLCVAKEISKINESYYRGTAKEILNSDLLPKGEFVIIIDKAPNTIDIKDFPISLPQHLEYYVNRGLNKNQAIKQVAKDLKLSKNEIYKEFLD